MKTVRYEMKNTRAEMNYYLCIAGKKNSELEGMGIETKIKFKEKYIFLNE